MSDREILRGQIDTLKKKQQLSAEPDGNRPLGEDLDLASRLEILEARLARMNEADGGAGEEARLESSPGDPTQEGFIEMIEVGS